MSEYFRLPFTPADGHSQGALMLQDLKLQAMSYSLRSKASWWTKYKDDTIRSKWKAEALAAPIDGDPILEPEVDYVLDELASSPTTAGYEKMRDDATGIQVILKGVIDRASPPPEESCFTRIYESDTLIPHELRDRLKEAVKVLEDVPEDQKDWHPRSDGQVLDLVHPSLYPIVYGRTLGYPRRKRPENRQIKDFRPVIGPDPSNIHRGEDWSFSEKFAWLSTDFKIAGDGSSAKAVSYINNLHPSHTELYSIIEALVARFSFLFDRVLTDLSCFHETWHPRITEHYTFEDGIYPGEEPEQEDGEDDDEYDARIEAWNMQRPLSLPTVPTDGYTKDISKRPKAYTIRGKEAQIIVKLANIHLTPEKPVYPGGSWHVEGMANERIVASGIYYYDSENISESELAFRALVDAMELNYDQYDNFAMRRIWGMTRDGGANQLIGATPTRAGRCLAFPNIYQHKVSPFELVDKTKPGHRKIIAFFLVDPEHPDVSTTDIPPQQAEWYEDAMLHQPPTSLLQRLPAELIRETTRQSPNLMTLDEAKKYRLELMDERTAFVETHDEYHYQAEFNFCEH
ncbi:hypothetical protein FS837_011825 [Tulasnella sp. UAMH 9824]|nr:hypothetical protein FS837_011825 [Tulasnella sp. UAMH 9824]